MAVGGSPGSGGEDAAANGAQGDEGDVQDVEGFLAQCSFDEKAIEAFRDSRAEVQQACLRSFRATDKPGVNVSARLLSFMREVGNRLKRDGGRQAATIAAPTEEEIATFRGQWSLEEASLSALAEYPADLQVAALARFKPGAGVQDPNGKFLSFVKSLARQSKVHGYLPEVDAKGKPGKPVGAAPAGVVVRPQLTGSIGAGGAPNGPPGVKAAKGKRSGAAADEEWWEEEEEAWHEESGPVGSKGSRKKGTVVAWNAWEERWEIAAAPVGERRPPLRGAGRAAAGPAWDASWQEWDAAPVGAGASSTKPSWQAEEAAAWDEGSWQPQAASWDEGWAEEAWEESWTEPAWSSKPIGSAGAPANANKGGKGKARNPAAGSSRQALGASVGGKGGSGGKIGKGASPPGLGGRSKGGGEKGAARR